MDGYILIDKQKGFTSHDVIYKIRKILNFKKIGHTGTLDPMAEGLLILCLGKYTKLSSTFSNLNKAYLAEISLGFETDTLDGDGEITEKIFLDESNMIKRDKILKELENIKNINKQVPPLVSAIKVNGVRAYRRFRAGQKIELPERDVKIYESRLIEYKENVIKAFFEVSKGTYIRSIARDIGLSLGTYGTLTKLTRMCIGKYRLEDAYTLKDIEIMFNRDDLSFLNIDLKH